MPWVLNEGSPPTYMMVVVRGLACLARPKSKGLISCDVRS
jgi:hypothetical protein